MNIQTVCKLIIHPSELAAFEFEMAKLNNFFDSDSEISLENFNHCEQSVDFDWNEDDYHKKREED